MRTLTISSEEIRKRAAIMRSAGQIQPESILIANSVPSPEPMLI